MATVRLYTPESTQKGMMELLLEYHMPSWELTRSEIRIAERLVEKGLVEKIGAWSFYIYHAKPRPGNEQSNYEDTAS